MKGKDKKNSDKTESPGKENSYIRVGTTYFKKIHKRDRFGIVRTEIKAWKKAEISQDHGMGFLQEIPKFDDFTIYPNNLNYSPIIHNCYNLYFEFSHQPRKGEWKWTQILLEHIFGEQYALGLRYLQILYLHPDRLMPILVLVSKIRQTGKTTFLNWLNMIFGNNIANIRPEDLINSFNSYYATSNIIAIEETLIKSDLTVEKLKSLATGKFISINRKFIDQYRLPFFGKIILTSNNEKKFARIDEEEIRFFIRKLQIPKHENHFIEKDLVKEIPAFLYYLTTLPPVDFSKDRTGFTPEELENESLKAVKAESKSDLYKDLILRIEDIFLNELKNETEFYADAMSMKKMFYITNNKIDLQQIRQVLKEEYCLLPEEKPIFFKPFKRGKGKTGRAYLFTRVMFTPQK